MGSNDASGSLELEYFVQSSGEDAPVVPVEAGDVGHRKK